MKISLRKLFWRKQKQIKETIIRDAIPLSELKMYCANININFEYCKLIFFDNVWNEVIQDIPMKS